MSAVRFGLIGFGAWGSHHARAIAKTPGAELVAVAARSAATCAAAREAFPKAHVHNDYRALLDREQLDVVDIVLPSHLHHEVASAVLSSGRHLLMEKPMALTLADCDHLIKLAAQKNRLLAIGHELRLSSLWGTAKEMVAAGAVGTPLYVLIELWRRPYRLGSDGWRYDIGRVGNWILEEPIHFFDLARWYLARHGDPVSVYARANSKQTGHPELHDNFSAVVGFPNGAYTVIAQTLAAYEHHQTAKVTGTSGALWASWSGAMDRTLHPTFSLKHFDGTTTSEVPITKITGEVFELEDEISMMAAAVREGRTGEGLGALATGTDGRWSVAMCLAAQQSVDTGSVVRMDEFLRSAKD
jgi:myo-inositol 2-dehydrogenase/D-chiro-inositol 1-dehydrogenase